jgi:S-adenosyl methyltransferase
MFHRSCRPPIPAANTTHEVAQGLNRAARIVYVGLRSLVPVHAWALLTSSPEGATDYIEADARDVGTILDSAAATLDFTRPVAITMLGILPFIGDDNEAKAIVTRLLAAVPTGSCLAVSEVSGDQVIEAVRQWNQGLCLLTTHFSGLVHIISGAPLRVRRSLQHAPAVPGTAAEPASL